MMPACVHSLLTLSAQACVKRCICLKNKSDEHLDLSCRLDKRDNMVELGCMVIAIGVLLSCELLMRSGATKVLNNRGNKSL